jgi:catechol 2,3-dioxygenase-like lactoylglutathione lyase family enzyme
MVSMKKALLAALLATSLCGYASAQVTPPAQTEKPHVIGLVHFIHATEKLETTVAFYRDVFGIDAPLRPNPNPAIAPLNNVPGITLRAARPVFASDKTAIEITDFGNVQKKGGQQAQPSDPGAIALLIPVRDLDSVVAAVKKCGAPILSHSGESVKIITPKGPRRALAMRDPDGYMVWAVEVPASEATNPGTVQPGLSMVVAVKDMGATAKFYRDMGFDVTGDMKFSHDKGLADLIGLPDKSQYRKMSAPIPGTINARVEFYEWKGMPRTPFHLNVYDPGAGGMVLRISDLNGLLARLKSEGIRVISADGAPVQFSPTSRNVFIVDINGMNLELTGMSQPPAVPQKQGS